MIFIHTKHWHTVDFSFDNSLQAFKTPLLFHNVLIREMPSRKRSKGKERRKVVVAARKQAETRQWWVNWATGDSDAGCGCTCNHGCATIPPPDHDVSKFMNTIWGHAELGNRTVLSVLEITFENNQEVWKDEALRRMAIGIFLSAGTILY